GAVAAANGIAIHVDHHDVVFRQRGLVAAGNRDGGVPTIQAKGEIAAGGRGPAQRRELADVGGKLTGKLAETRGIVCRFSHAAQSNAGVAQSASSGFRRSTRKPVYAITSATTGPTRLKNAYGA